MNYNLYFTLDYEIHGNGDGNPIDLMVGPTYRLMDMLEQYTLLQTLLGTNGQRRFSCARGGATAV